MSLLDNASLVLTPNAYKEGKLYSVIPSNGNGDFTATRATTATRVNSAGLVDLVPYNLLRYSEMFADASWNKQNATISANTTTAPDGTLTADKLVADTTLGQHRIFQGGQTLDSGAYVVSCYAKAAEYSFFSMGASGGATGGSIIFNLSNGTISGTASNITPTIQSVGNGWYRCSLAFTSATPNLSYWLIARNANNTSDYSGDGTSGIFIWGAQLVQGTSARDYLRTETRLNIPRIDYSLGGCPNILLEPQRTNLALQSSSFDSATWAKTRTTVSANATTSPSGVIDADKMIETATTGVHGINQSTLPASTGSFTYFVYAKKSERSWVILNLFTGLSGGDCLVWFDLNSGTIGTITNGVGSSSTTAAIENAGNGWYKCSMTINKTSTITGAISIIISNANNIINYTGDGTSGLFIWGAQLEAGAYATSYIPTTTASVTRNQDICSASIPSILNASNGTLFVEAFPVVTSAVNQTIITINNGSTARGFWIGLDNGVLNVRYRNGAGILAISTSLTLTNLQSVKIALTWNGTAISLFANGVKRINNISLGADYPSTINTIQLQGDGSFFNINRNFINQTALFPTPLTDAQCIALTQ